MKKFRIVAVCLTYVSCLFFTGQSFAELAQGMGDGGWGADSKYGKMYKPQTVETISGTVIAVGEVTPMNGMETGMYVVVKTRYNDVTVHVGPCWYLEHQNVIIASGDSIEVTGSKITLDGKTVIIAKQIKKGDQVLALRDMDGNPTWNAWKQK